MSNSPMESGIFPKGFSTTTDFAWPLVPAGSIVDLVYGDGLTEKTRSPGPVPVYGTNGRCGWHDTPLTKGPGVILGRKGMGNLGVEWCESDFWVIDTAYYVRPLIPDIDLKYFYYLVKYIGLNHLKDGTSNPSLTRDTFKKLLLPLPPRSDQTKIQQILSLFDDKIELNRRMNETLEAMAKTLFQSWFVDFDPVHAKAAVRREHPKWTNAQVSQAALPHLDPAVAELFPDRFEESTLGPVSAGWRATTVPDVIEVNPTRSLPKGTVAPYLEMSNMPTRSARATAWEERSFESGTKFTNGDTLVARITPCLENGKTAYVDFLQDGQVGAGSTEYIILRPKPPLPTTFAYYLARNEDFRQHLITNMTGTSGRQRAPADCLNSYGIVVPPESIAMHFGAFAERGMEQMKANDEKSRELAAARDSLLPRLLSGDLSLTAEVV